MPGARELRMWVPVGLLGAGCALLLLAKQQEVMPLVQPLEAVVPDSLLGRGSWDREVPEAERVVAGMDNYVLRHYTTGEEPEWDFSVYVGYYEVQAQGKSIHSPKNCLPGAGWEPVSAGTTEVVVEGVRYTVNRFLLANANLRALVYYWYQGRGRVAWNEYAVKWDLLRDKALHGRSEEALVRIVVPVKGTEDEADAIAEATAKQLIDPIFKALPALTDSPALARADGGA